MYYIQREKKEGPFSHKILWCISDVSDVAVESYLVHMRLTEFFFRFIDWNAWIQIGCCWCRWSWKICADNSIDTESLCRRIRSNDWRFLQKTGSIFLNSTSVTKFWHLLIENFLGDYWWRNMFIGYFGHRRSRGIQRDERSVHENRGWFFVGFCGEFKKKFWGIIQYIYHTPIVKLPNS